MTPTNNRLWNDDSPRIIPFFSYPFVFSNFYKCHFIDYEGTHYEGTHYNSSEQYYMSWKAKMFDDDFALEKIMKKDHED